MHALGACLAQSFLQRIRRHEDHGRRRRTGFDEHGHAVAPRHAYVHDDDVVAPGTDLLEGSVAVPHSRHLVAGRAEDVSERFQHAGLIVDDEHLTRHASTSVRCLSSTGSRGAAIAGRTTRNVLPSPTTLSTVISPRCASTTRLQTARPRPMPRAFVVKKGSNSRFRTLLGMPCPVSVTHNRT